MEAYAVRITVLPDLVGGNLRELYLLLRDPKNAILNQYETATEEAKEQYLA